MTKPCMKPVVCEIGDAIKAMSSAPILSADESARSPNRIVLWV